MSSAACAAGTHDRCHHTTCVCNCHVVTVCTITSCRRAAARNGHCAYHQRQVERLPGGLVAVDLTEDELDAIRAQVEADAAPLFIAAMQYIASRQVATLSPAGLRALGVGDE